MKLHADHAYVIAEAGVNHNGSTAMARELVLAAKKAGADAVKFQTFQADRVARASAPKAQYQLAQTDPAESQLEMLRKLELPYEAHRELFLLCRELGLDFLSTPYNEEDADFLAELGVGAFKLASIHVVEPHFLGLVARKRRPILLATGMATLSEVGLAVRAVRETGNDQLVLLQCTTDYPAKAEDANLRAIPTLREAFNLPVGYSDHTQGDTCCVAAIALGACVIEKHFTLDRRLPGPDHFSAAEPEEFAGLVRKIRETEAALGTGRKEPSFAEGKNAPRMRRSLVARLRIAKGERIVEEQLTCRRPSGGISPLLFAQVVGSEALRDVLPGEPLAWEMLRKH